ncbi:Serine/threonine-protein kinase TOR [Capsicum baccatum]|uniref:Serine/threonine-protein kinase TOR n=1 Tax=Capsicum baccatum TaxID=33114 RepID=A0A2G2XFN2_CAPBA|nr:Serine/threonine-protein kinase TOR [Capsicum baccatum]
MMSRYKEVAEIVLRYLEHRDRLVRLSITSLLSRIAHLLRDRFVTNYLMICINHILYVLKIPAECASGFIALGEIAGALDGELTNYLSTISSHLHDAIAPRRGRPSLEALACVGNIAKAMGPTMEPHVRGLLDSMFSFRLSLTLVEALEQITESIPLLLPTIQSRLLKCISVILSRSHHSMPRQSTSVSRGHITTVTPQVPELSGSVLVQLSLRTLAHFNFKGHDLLVFARESIVVYLEEEDGATRKDVALCCCKLVANSFTVISFTQFSLSRINCASGKRHRRLMEEVFDEKENESKAAKLKSWAKGSKNFMSLTISASSKIAQSRKKKILMERNDPLINDLCRINDVHPIKFMNLNALEESSNIYHGYFKGSTGSEKLDEKFEPIELEEDEESETEPDEKEFQMDADLDDGGEVEIEGVDVLEIEEASAIQLAEVNGADSLEKDVEQGMHDLVETEKVSVVPAEGNEYDSSERDLNQGLTTSNVEVELAES